MKHNSILYKLSIFSIAILAFTSCDSVIDKDPVLQTTDTNVFSSKDKIESNLLGIYSDVKNFLAYKGYAYSDIRGDDVYSLSNNVYNCYSVYEMAIGESTEDNTNAWSSLYRAINETNTFLVNLDKHKDIAGASYDQYVAEAKFLRALSYYQLNSLYSDPYSINNAAKSVPLRLQSEGSTANDNLKRSTNAEVLSQILNDISDSNISNLKNGGNSYNGETRATEGAAHVLRQRVYMELGDWTNAIKEGEAVSGYSLTQNVSDIFHNNINTETIFAFPMADTNKGANQTAMASYYASGNVFVLDDKYGFLADKAYSLPKDKRVSDLIGKIGSNYILKKYYDLSNYLDWIQVFRYAEVELNLAESYYNNKQEDKARQYLKNVRRRSVAAIDDIIDVDKLSGTDLLKAIYFERRAELVGEAVRSIDIHRRGETYYKRNGTFTPTTNGYTWPIPSSETVINKLIND